VKPNLMGRPGTDRALVERLLALLCEHGYAELALVESRTGRDESRAVAAAAREAGYGVEGYRIVDLSEEPVPFDYGSVLGKATIGRTWLEADYRITFAKAKPQRRCFYSGCLANLLGCLPEPDKLSHCSPSGTCAPRAFHSLRTRSRLASSQIALLITVEPPTVAPCTSSMW
jgi:uncharacterized protein (DUF362 family)